MNEPEKMNYEKKVGLKRCWAKESAGGLYLISEFVILIILNLRKNVQKEMD
jgi:hypothetical protein